MCREDRQSGGSAIMKKLLLGTMALSLVVVAVGCSNNTPAPAKQAETKQEQKADPAQAKEGTYVSKEGKFSFTTPSNWTGNYKAVELSGEKAQEMAPVAKHAVSFLYSKNGKEATLTTIATYSKEDWAKVAAEDGPPVGELIKEENGIAYVQVNPQEMPFEPQSAEGELFMRMYVPVDMVKESLIPTK